ncbi:MAG TPA: transposase [Bellilinea sp.]|nr:transposase [Bellilinea sp.]
MDLFGSIKENLVKLSDLGRIAENEWQRLEKRFQYIQLGARIIMPNHVHGIITINFNEANLLQKKNGVNRAGIEQFGSPVAGSIATIVRSYKSLVTQRYQWFTQSRFAKVWQRGFYDHVIRSEKDMENVENYILNNPIKWSEDENFIIHP